MSLPSVTYPLSSSLSPPPSLLLPLSSSLHFHLNLCLCRDLADVDKDGRMTSDEFAIAMHLVEKAKQGIPIPSTLPVELTPSQQGLRNTPSSPMVVSSFEDRRKANFEQGRQELERRQKLLQEQEEKEKVTNGDIVHGLLELMAVITRRRRNAGSRKRRSEGGSNSGFDQWVH